jgi:hypothetical protein
MNFDPQTDGSTNIGKELAKFVANISCLLTLQIVSLLWTQELTHSR